MTMSIFTQNKKECTWCPELIQSVEVCGTRGHIKNCSFKKFLFCWCGQEGSACWLHFSMRASSIIDSTGINWSYRNLYFCIIWSNTGLCWTTSTTRQHRWAAKCPSVTCQLSQKITFKVKVKLISQGCTGSQQCV